jgi:superfamily II DNA/RNA helicase
MYFTHDGGDVSQWRLKGHAIKKFWNYVKSWSCFVSNPSDLGFDGTKFILPKLNLIERKIDVPVKQGMLFNHLSVSATNFNQELRETLKERMKEVIRIVNNSEDNFIIWVKQNVEADYLMDEIPDATEVRGSEDSEVKERKLLDFAHNKFRVLITKTKIAGLGMNFQNCHNMVDASLDFSFEGLYQKIRRAYRFGQQYDVNYYMITTDTMRNVIESINRKEEQFNQMKNHLTNGKIYIAERRLC